MSCQKVHCKCLLCSIFHGNTNINDNALRRGQSNKGLYMIWAIFWPPLQKMSIFTKVGVLAPMLLKNILEIVQPSRCHGNTLLQIDVYVTVVVRWIIL